MCTGVSIWPVTQKVGMPGSVGHLFLGTTMKIVKQDGSLANYGEQGELWVRSPQVALGYYRNEKVMKETFIDGWVRTGDIAYFKPNGDLFIVDHAKEIIKVKGFQVTPVELEGHLLSHLAVADAGVIGITDDYRGEQPLAFIVIKEKYSDIVKRHPSGPVAEKLKKDIFDHVAKHKSNYKWITGGIIFVDDLPKNSSGKLLRRVLKERVKPHCASAMAKL